jgi:cell division protease FtsH
MTNITMTDVAGIEEAKEEVAEIIEFLKHPKKFQRLGGRIPRGVLLVGDPGCGKTLLAKAVAGEAEVPFYSISGSDFVEMFVGVGASRVRDLFKQAKESSPCIIFLDEIDAVGRRRGGGFTTGGHDEREQTLNAILVEMDGFETNDQVIVMAATNRSDVLDPALTRPGRFDRQISVPLPDIKGRLEILRVHGRKVRMSPNVDMEKLAKQTPMFSGADLAAIINEAAIIATLGGKEFVEMADLEEARDKVKFGRAKKSRKVEEEERIGTAYHEAGHAIINLELDDCDPLHKVTIIPRGQAMGATFSLPEKDRYGYGKNYINAEIRRLCGGRIAESKQTGDVTSGAAMDIRMATQYARHMVLEWGMSDRLGFVDYSGDDNPNHIMPEKGYSDETARAIDEEIKRIIDEGYSDAEQLIGQKWQEVDALAQGLLKYETLSAEEARKIINGEALNKPSVSELLESEASKPSKARAAATQPQDTGPETAGGSGPVPRPA